MNDKTVRCKCRAKFSIVISTWNRRKHVLQAIESVKAQTYPASQIIVVVDGSTDGTADAVRAGHPDVLVFEQENRGISVARNCGIALASGDWIGLLDDDDLYHRDKLKMAAQYIAEHPDCAAINNPHFYFAESEDGPGERLAIRRDFVAPDYLSCQATADRMGTECPAMTKWLDVKGRSFEAMMERNRGVMSSSLVRKDLLIRAGCFCPMQRMVEDWTMFVNVARLTEWHTLPHRLGFTRFHGVQVTSTGSMDEIHSLVILINAWMAGRPLPHRVSGWQERNALAAYGPIYRRFIQGFIWWAIRHRQLRAAGILILCGKLLLPRIRDMLYVFIPPQVTWRWEKYVLGRHR